MNTEFAPLFQLGRAERIQLVADLWDSIAQEDAPLPVPDWKREELRRRKERFFQHPESGRSWEEVKRRARSQND
jgi:putative addiction module component (TIGR02574 family)